MTSPCRATSARFLRSLLLCGLFIPGLLSLPACSVNPPLDLAEVTGSDQAVHLDQVPFYPQQEFQCGPAALAGLLVNSGVDTDPDLLKDQVYIPERQGSLQIEMLAATRRAGRIAYQPGPEPAQLFAQLEAGIPVLVMQNLRTPHFPAWHYAVLVGFDAETGEVLLNSGTERGMRMKARSFMRSWEWADHWALVALQPGRLPAVPDGDRLFEALAAFQASAGAAAAEPAWRSAAEAMPAEPRFALALGNIAYAAQQHDEALRQYRRGLALDPGHPALLNNLASVLWELGCEEEAQASLDTALNTLPGDSPWREILEETRAETAAVAPGEQRDCAALAGM